MLKQESILKRNLAVAAIILLVLFLVCFPKGGIKINGIPLTWGYLLIFGFAGALIPRYLLSLFATPLVLDTSLVVFLQLPFLALVGLSFLIHGVENFGFAISLIVSFAILPFVFLKLFSTEIDGSNFEFLLKLIRYAIIFVSFYGILLFFYRIVFGEFIEIPYLTVNSDDVGGLDDKHINRGGIFKLISTYNNGNIYGICILMLLPLFETIEKRAFYRYVVRISLVLTLSRTVWLGMLLHQLTYHVFVLRVPYRLVVKNIIYSLVDFRVRKDNFIFVQKFIFFSIVFFGALYYISLQIGSGVEFLFDRDLGGRVDQFSVLTGISFFPNRPFDQISEIVYLSVLDEFGLLGFLLFFVAILSPLLVYFLTSRGGGGILNRSIVSGLVLYLALAFSDGAMLFIPVMSFYWFLASLLFVRYRG